MSATATPGAMPERGFGPPHSPWTPWALAWSVPKPWLIVATVLAFIAFFPIGIAMLFFLIGTGRLFGHCARAEGHGSGQGMVMQSRGCGWRRGGAAAGSGNQAFDEYRADTLRRLEEEQREFAGFLERLRFARDKAEFDQFVAERRPRPEPPAEPPRG